MSRFGRNELAVGFLVLGALGLLAWMSLQLGTLRRVGEEVHVSALFSTAAGLTEGAAVQVAGVPVGRVDQLEVESGRARVHLALKESAGLRKDAVAQIRARSVLGEKYIELLPSSEQTPPLEDGDELMVGADPLEIDQFVNQLGPVVSSVDPGALSELIRALSELYKDDPERLRRVAEDVETILHNAALASEEAPALAREARDTLAELRQAAREARPVIRRADAAIGQAEQTLARAPATVDELQALLSDGRAAVSDGRAMMSKVDGSMDEVQVVLDNLSEIDRWELRRILREEGITVRLRPREIVPEPEGVAGGAD